MRINSLAKWLRLPALALFSVFLVACGTGEGEEQVADPFFAECSARTASSARCPLDPVPSPPIPAVLDSYIYATDPAITEDLVPGSIDDFGGAMTFEGDFTGDGTFNPVFQVTSGTGFSAPPPALPVHVGFVAFNNISNGFAAGFDFLYFKVKGLPGNSIEVKFINNGDTSRVYDLSTYLGATDIGNGWTQVVIPLTDFAATIANNSGLLLGPLGDQGAPFSFLLTDIGFTDPTSTPPGGGGTATGGEVPEVVIAAADGSTPDLVAGVDFTGFTVFGTGGNFNAAFAGDSSYANAIEVTVGPGYGGGALAQLGVEGFVAGFATGYDELLFKVKGLTVDNTILVKLEEPFPGLSTPVTVDLAAPGAGVTVTDLGDGWSQVVIDMGGYGDVSTFSQIVFQTLDGAYAAGDTFYLTDVGFNNASGGGPSGTATIDFEPGGFGAGFTWTTFENDDNPALEIVANPDPGGINNTATVAKFTARVTGMPWAGTETAHGDVGPYIIDASTRYVKIWVYKTVVSDVGIKLVVENGAALPEIKVANTQINQWEQLTFDFNGHIGFGEYATMNIDQVVVFPDFNLAGRAGETISYFDNISFEATP